MNFWDSLARHMRRSQTQTPALLFRTLLAGMDDNSQFDPYREPLFDRVWVTTEKRKPITTYGLDFAGRTINGELHHDLRHYADWTAARRMLLEQLAAIVLDEDRHYQHALTGPRS